MDAQSIRENLNKKPTNELLDILGYSQDDYTPTAISYIKEILLTRGINEEEIKVLDESFNSLVNTIEKSNSQKRLPFYQKAFLGILTVASIAMFSYLKKLILPAVATKIAQTETKQSVTFFTDSTANTIRKAIMEDTTIHISQSAREYYCNCYIAAVKNRFPIPLGNSISDDTLKSLANECIEKLKASGIK